MVDQSLQYCRHFSYYPIGTGTRQHGQAPQQTQLKTNSICRYIISTQLSTEFKVLHTH